MIYHDDPIGQGEGFLLIMGDVKKRDAQPALQRLELDLHLFPHLAVQGGERLVEQEETRSIDERARQRNALLLAAREFARPPLAHRLHAHHLQGAGDPVAPARRAAGGAA